MVTGDGAYIKKLNRSLILREINENGMVSRADLSKITGLNKATISVQVAQLLEEELIYETQQEHHVVGRRPIMLSINQEAGHVLGIDLDQKEIQFAVSDLLGSPVYSCEIPLETDNYEEIVQILINQVNNCITKCSNSRYGLVSVVIGVHGTVNKSEEVRFIPKFQWHHKNLRADLEKQLNIPISIENNANLSAYAEKVFKHHNCDHLLTVILASGIGAGTIIDGEIQKGYHGYAGEMGHMIIYPDGTPCQCGNFGCWERYASETSLTGQLSTALNNPSLTFNDVRLLLMEKESITNDQMERFIKDISIGVNNIINLYNPETLVLNSELLQIYPTAIEKIKRNLVSSVSQYREIVLSELGNKACVMGACALAIQRFLDIPQLILDKPKYQLVN
ncbi:ROK family transcriptional regulator [Shouchella shacheensis]|uniref:ROK family transcriptional regulator n=1 Tax=Shouchella shacheensis TaxID=1649580 RepID=UPI0007403B42|nr:ROK family transcriptional regulator [Shouchella shacheensis]